MSHDHKIPQMVVKIDIKNFDHLVDTARRALHPTSGLEADNDRRELAELFLVFANYAILEDGT